MTKEESQNKAAPGLPGTRRRQISAGTWSNVVSVLLILSTFGAEQTTQTRLVRLTTAAVLTFVVHIYLLCFSPPEQQRLSSLVLAIIGGPMAVYLALLMLW